MIIFERLFATYYFFFVRKKHFQKRLGLSKFLVERNEDDGTVALLAASQFLVSMLVFGLFINRYKLNVAPLIFVVFAFYGFLILSQHFYFLNNQERRRKVIEEFRELPRRSQITWGIVATCLILGPICLFPVLSSR